MRLTTALQNDNQRYILDDSITSYCCVSFCCVWAMTVGVSHDVLHVEMKPDGTRDKEVSVSHM